MDRCLDSSELTEHQGDYEDLEEIQEVNEFLIENNAVGILIGGKAYGFVAGAHPVEIDKRKDTDVLVVMGGQKTWHHTPYDLFLPDKNGTFRNRNDFTLPYHIHYLGDELEPGLYLPPPEVIFLTENEMATRRAVDRVVPDVIEHRMGPLSSSIKPLNLKDIVLEFPGDVSWLGKSLPSVPIYLCSRKEDDRGGKRTFISFKWRNEASLPRTAYPDEKDVRTPEMLSENVFPSAELTHKQVYANGLTLIKSGFVKEGTEYIIDRCPDMADDKILLDRILRNKDEYPIQCSEAFALWLKVAQERNFLSLLLLHEKFEDEYMCRAVQNSTVLKDVHNLGDIIFERFGLRFKDLAEKLKNFKFESLMSIEWAELPEKHQHIIRECMLAHTIIFKNLRYYNAKSNDGEDIQVKVLFWHKLITKIYDDEENEYLFNNDYYEACQKMGISDDDIKKAFFHKYLNYDLIGEGFNMKRLNQRLVKSDKRTILEMIKDEYNEVFEVLLSMLVEGKDLPIDKGKEYFEVILELTGFKTKTELRRKLRNMAGIKIDEKEFKSGLQRQDTLRELNENLNSYFGSKR